MNALNEQQVGIVRQLEFFHGMAPDSMEELVAGALMQQVERDHTLIRRSDQLSGFYAVLEGRLKLYLLGCDGDERVVRILKEGDTFAEALAFSAIPSPVFVDSLTSARLAYFPRSVLMNMQRARPDFSLAVIKGLSGLLKLLIDDIESCCTLHASERVAAYLLREFPRDRTSGEVTLPASKANVASTLNLSPETFSRELHRLENQGLIQIDKRRIEIPDLQALRSRSRLEDQEPFQLT